MAAGVTGLSTLILVTAAMMIVMIVPQDKMDIDDNPQNDDQLDNDFFTEPYPKQLSLAPYFGYFVTLSLMGNPINSDKNDPHAVPDMYVAARIFVVHFGCLRPDE